MADVFLSYNREDKPRAEAIARALEAEGFSVWWDTVLRAGETYDEVTERNLREASAVVVLWSERSVKSKWVRAEATLGQRKSSLVPAMIEECERPLLFELVQTADLTTWDGDREDEEWRNFVGVIKARVEEFEHKKEEAASPAAANEAAGLSDDVTIETTFWNSIKDSGGAADFEAYLERFPNGHFASLARNRIAALAAPAAAPKPAPAPAPAPKAEAAPPRAPEPKKGGGGGLIVAIVLLLAAAGGGYAYFATDLFKGGASPDSDTVADAGEAADDAAAATSETEAAPEDAEEPAPAAASSPASAESFADCADCPTMVAIPAGSFMMGSPGSEPGRYAYEGPQREVRVDAFAIGRFEVTFDQWLACVEDGGCGRYEPGDEGWGRGDRPVINVSWNDAQQYVGWLSVKTGRRYRLPTEAEWEYAARGGTETAYWWGASFDESKVARRTTRPVGSFPANPFGLHDMLSNAREWVEDCYSRSYAGLPADARAVTTGDCAQRTVRGGSYRSQPRDVRVANRARFSRSVRDDYLGFRVVTDAR